MNAWKSVVYALKSHVMFIFTSELRGRVLSIIRSEPKTLPLLPVEPIGSGNPIYSGSYQTDEIFGPKKLFYILLFCFLCYIALYPKSQFTYFAESFLAKFPAARTDKHFLSFVLL